MTAGHKAYPVVADLLAHHRIEPGENYPKCSLPAARHSSSSVKLIRSEASSTLIIVLLLLLY